MMVNLLYLFVVAVQSLSCVQLFVTPRTAAHQAPLSFTISWSLLKFMSIELVMPSNHLILCRPFLLLPSIVPASGGQSIGASASASVLPMSIQGWFSSRLTGLISLLAKGLSGVFSSTTVWRHQFFGALPSLLSSSYHHVWLLGRPEPWLYGLLSAE